MRRRLQRCWALVRRVRVRREHVAVAAVVFVVALAAVPTPAAASFELNMSGLLDTASNMFNALWPAFAVIAGLGIGFAILTFIVNAIRQAF